MEEEPGWRSIFTDNKEKDMSKVKLCACHKSRHYVSQCLNKNKGEGKTAIAATAQME